MAEEQKPAPDPVAADLVDSVLSHPGLQVETAPSGQPVPAADTSAAWTPGTPSGQPVAQQQPARAERQEPTPPAPEPASQSGRLIAGKYRSVEEAERGIRELNTTLREREAENRALKAVNMHLEQVFTPRQQREEPKALPVTFDKENQPIVNVEAMREIITQEAQRAARETMESTLKPLSALSQANARLRADYPEIAQREGEFAEWLQANPEAQRRATQDPEWGLEAAYLKFDRVRGQATRAEHNQAAQAAQAQVQNARANAGPVSGAAGGRRPAEAEAVSKRLMELYQYGVESGNMKPYAKARLEYAMGDQALETLDKATWGR